MGNSQGKVSDQFKMDVFSIGCIFYQMLRIAATGAHWYLFEVSQELEKSVNASKLLSYMQTRRETAIPELKKWQAQCGLIDENSMKLLEWMLQANPEQRPNINQCLAHDYFKTNESAATCVPSDEQRETVLQRLSDLND